MTKKPNILTKLIPVSVIPCLLLTSYLAAGYDNLREVRGAERGKGVVFDPPRINLEEHERNGTRKFGIAEDSNFCGGITHTISAFRVSGYATDADVPAWDRVENILRLVDQDVDIRGCGRKKCWSWGATAKIELERLSGIIEEVKFMRTLGNEHSWLAVKFVGSKEWYAFDRTIKQFMDMQERSDIKTSGFYGTYEQACKIAPYFANSCEIYREDGDIPIYRPERTFARSVAIRRYGVFRCP